MTPGPGEPGDYYDALVVMVAELTFPAAVWQLVAHAHSWGAPADCVEKLTHLPTGTYRDRRAVLTALGFGQRVQSCPPSPDGVERPLPRPRRWEDIHTTLPTSDML